MKNGLMKTRKLVLAMFLLMISVVMTVQTSGHALSTWRAGKTVDRKVVESQPLERWFTAQPIPDEVFARMKGRSFPADCTVPRSSLRYLRVLHVDAEGRVKMGEVVCNRLIADDLIAIFRELYRQRYALECVRLIDDFDAEDERSMRANNTSSFCFRRVKGSTRLSAHARGMAIDFNTLYNPYYKKRAHGTVVQPSNALRYCDRSANFPYKITKGDLLYRLCVAHGFRWGGAWRTVKDWQHFEAASASF